MIVSISRCRRAVGIKINNLRAASPSDLAGIDELAHVRARRADEQARERTCERRDSNRALCHQSFNTVFTLCFQAFYSLSTD